MSERSVKHLKDKKVEKQMLKTKKKSSRYN